MNIPSRSTLFVGGVLTVLMSSIMAAPLSYAQDTADTTQYFTLNPNGQSAPTTAPATAMDGASHETMLKSGFPVPHAAVHDKFNKQKSKFKSFKDGRRTKFNAKKQKLCQQRQSKLNKNMVRSSNRSIKQANQFDKLVPRIEAYIAKRNLTITDYQVMMTEIAIRKVDVEASLQTLQTMKSEFKCDGETASASAVAYKDALKSANVAIKGYRDAIKKLLDAAVAANKARKAQDGASATTSASTTKLSLEAVEQAKQQLDARAASAPASVTSWGADPADGRVLVRVTTSQRTPEIDQFLEGIDPNAILLIFNSPQLKSL